MSGHEVRRTGTGKGQRVDEEKSEDDDDAAQEDPPEAAVHEGFDVLLAVEKFFHSEVEGVEGPDVEGGQGCGEREDDKEDEGAGCFWADDGEGRNRVDDTEDEVGKGESSAVPHKAAKGWSRNTVVSIKS